MSSRRPFASTSRRPRCSASGTRCALRAALLLLAAAGACSCATTDTYQASLDSWIGAAQSELLRAWGTPTRELEGSGGRHVVVYETSRTIMLPGTVMVAPMTGATVAGAPDTRVTVYCSTSFESDGTLIVAVNHAGNGCVASGKAPARR